MKSLEHPLRRPLAPRSTQTGATLVVGLVLLLVLTVLGVSGMNTATMELTMAGNAQFAQDAFQMAEDGIDIVLARELYGTGAPTTLPFDGTPVDRSAVTTYLDGLNTMAPGFSGSDIEAFHFNVVSVGRGPRTGTSVHRQSFYLIGRALN
jgi:hypothetical protein